MADKHTAAFWAGGAALMAGGGIFMAVTGFEPTKTPTTVWANSWFDLGFAFVTIGLLVTGIGVVLHFHNEVDPGSAPPSALTAGEPPATALPDPAAVPARPSRDGQIDHLLIAGGAGNPPRLSQLAGDVVGAAPTRHTPVSIARYWLSVPEYEGPEAWQWRLVDDRGNILTHQVRLNTDEWEYRAAWDLPRYITEHSSDVDFDEANVIKAVGNWIGECILGPIGHKLVTQKPAVVTLQVSGSARKLALLPLESARINEEPLLMHSVAMVTDAEDPDKFPFPADTSPDDKIRVLAIFPAKGDDLGFNQRGERSALESMMGNIAEAEGIAIDFRALQYDVTYDPLSDALMDSQSWDVIHVSGYAEPGLLQISSDGGPLTSEHLAGLVDLLDRFCVRPKLITISAYVSAAGIAARALQLPGLDDPPSGADWPAKGIDMACDLAGRLGCAVTTFRFPVTDDFAFNYFRRLYYLLIAQKQPLHRAVAMAWQDLSMTWPALPLTGPALVGARAADLQLHAPLQSATDSRRASLDLAMLKDEPADLFVGRNDLMRQASAALAYGGEHSGVLLYGMPGIGKTSCARELAFTRDSLDPRNRFTLAIRHEITGDDNGSTRMPLQQFMKTLRQGIGGDFPEPGVLENEEVLDAELPRMTEYFRKYRVLLVIENAEKALDATGRWRDRWGLIISALTKNPKGHGRVLLTSRRLPADPLPGVLVLPVGALGWNDSMLLARNPGPLRSLLDSKADGASEPEDKARQVMIATRGHPKLLELANVAVGSSAQLATLLATVDAWPLREPHPSVTGKTTDYSEEEYVRLIEQWSATIAATLDRETRAFFQVVCCVDEEDRAMPVLEANWQPLTGHVAQCDCSQSLTRLVAVLHRHALATGELDAHSALSLVRVHPVVAEHGRREAGSAIRKAVDAQLAGYWAERAARGELGADLSAAVYQLRLRGGDDRATIEEEA